MSNSSIRNKILAFSPYLEILVRRFYWKHVSFLSKFNRKKKSAEEKIKSAELSKLISKLSEWGVHEGDLVVVHSSFDALKGTGKTAAQAVDDILNFLGPSGTLAMPAMPIFRNDVSKDEYLDADISETTFIYDRRKSRIKTGALPTALSKYPNAVRSMHPINTMVAAGRLAERLMMDNLLGDSPLPCGNNSSWHHCFEENAWIVGLGTDLTHSLTMIHVAEDIQDTKWPVGGWYRLKHFQIIDGDDRKNRTLRERKPKWGTLCFAERTLCKDLLRIGIMKSTVIDGVLLEAVRARALIDFLMKKNKKGYPYFGLNI